MKLAEMAPQKLSTAAAITTATVEPRTHFVLSVTFSRAKNTRKYEKRAWSKIDTLLFW